MTDIASRLIPIVEELQNAGILLPQVEKQFRRIYIDAALKRCRGNKTRASQCLGIHRNTLMNELRARRTDEATAIRKERASLLGKVARLNKRINSAASRRRR